jgi:hypothetical protein
MKEEEMKEEGCGERPQNSCVSATRPSTRLKCCKKREKETPSAHFFIIKPTRCTNFSNLFWN